ncbi:MAG: Co2+/Mg2+ efflux protein ApaG [Gammaproteobacteria bacterium]|nr:Co2+/Mg2+ efflux protein ApaG [Gammaproteobacteria bacterium]MBU1775662.1 Co2+/Mg2+ efflux protein ApaG [Gammaproteobacteria bacterium]MBU1968137.1 Co2+/Mg2+ efflux protein ApaG [Gammaproteobacteria bacterium]
MEDNSLYRIKVAVQVRYLADQSDEADNRHVFAYTITLTNEGEHAVQLLSRHWIINDANNHVQEVKGKGVVGEQPVIKPGQSFEYTSGTVLATQVGTMSGSYQMQVLDGGEFSVPIPQFVLSVPRVLH